MKKQKFEFHYDRVANALYLKVGNGKVAKTEETSLGFFVDYDKEGGIIGIEIVNVEKTPEPNKIILNLSESQKVPC